MNEHDYASTTTGSVIGSPECSSVERNRERPGEVITSQGVKKPGVGQVHSVEKSCGADLYIECSESTRCYSLSPVILSFLVEVF